MPPSDPSAVPPPEWALDAAHEYFSDQWTHLGIPKGIAVNVSPLARLLASVREGALREAAEKCWVVQNQLIDAGLKDGTVWRDPHGGYDASPAMIAADDCEDAILSLLHTPPSGGAG